MRTINAELLAQFESEQLRAFRLLDFDIDATHYRYTNCDVPLILASGDELIINGDMELTTNWNNYGTPTTNERSSEQSHGGTYSRKFVTDSSDNDGIESDAFTTTTGMKYSCELRVYPVDTTSVTIMTRYGTGGSSYNYISTHSTLTQNAWNRINFSYFEASGGSLAVIVIMSALVGTWYVDDVSNKENNIFQPKDFRIENVGYSSNQFVDRMQIEIDDIKAVLRSAFLDGTPQDSSTTLLVAVVDSKGLILDSGNAYATLFDGEIDDWSLDEKNISISITSILTKWAQKTLSKYSASCRWKKFKGTECTYSGGETWCDRTYVRCTALGNTANFGGFRWLPSIVDKEIWWGRMPANE